MGLGLGLPAELGRAGRVRVSAWVRVRVKAARFWCKNAPAISSKSSLRVRVSVWVRVRVWVRVCVRVWISVRVRVRVKGTG